MTSSTQHEDYNNMTHVLEDAADMYEQRRKQWVSDIVTRIKETTAHLRDDRNSAKFLVEFAFDNMLSQEERAEIFGNLALLCEEIYSLDQIRLAFEWNEEEVGEEIDITY